MLAEVSVFAEFEIAKLGLTIELDLVVEEIPVRVDLVQIEQVLLNLVRNALDALEEVPPNRRRLTMRGRREGTLGGGHGRGYGTRHPPGGHGAALRCLSLLPKSTGMGMGLPISQTILDNHGGELRVDSEPGVGTRFQVLLPLASEADPV
jgi:two-component system sensor kinase FixL